ncbi:MAG TPA: FAD-binding protein, partial [Bacteroidales bacterium]|nr:FAD-binding protein [Bacteroidales bacterium]
MRKEIEIAMTPKQASDPSGWKTAFAHILHIQPGRIKHLNPVLRAVDARSSKVKIRLKAELFIDELPKDIQKFTRKTYPDVSRKAPVIVVG